ncbi:hypothetical protein Tco_0067262 [Tanacetum coccineum]
MDQDSVHMVAASKVPMLKPGEYEIWRMRIEQYIQMIDYALWEVIENGATLPKTTTVEGVLKFNSIKDAKNLLEAVEKRFGGNEATKKTQRNLLKQQYENFTDPSLEMLDQTFDKLQKLMSQLELLGEKISQEDVNQKLLRSTDKAKISRKRSKPDKHEHENERARKEPGESYQKVYTSPSTLIGGDPRKDDTVDMKEAQGNKAYTLEVLTKEARPVTITDCHTGNPCSLQSNLTALNDDPMIGGNERTR